MEYPGKKNQFGHTFSLTVKEFSSDSDLLNRNNECISLIYSPEYRCNLFESLFEYKTPFRNRRNFWSNNIIHFTVSKLSFYTRDRMMEVTASVINTSPGTDTTENLYLIWIYY